MFDAFCDALEVKNGTIAGPGGFGVQHALVAWASFWIDVYYNYGKYCTVGCITMPLTFLSCNCLACGVGTTVL